MKKFVVFLGLGIATGVAYKAGEWVWNELLESKAYKLKHTFGRKKSKNIIEFKKK